MISGGLRPNAWSILDRMLRTVEAWLTVERRVGGNGRPIDPDLTKCVAVLRFVSSSCYFYRRFFI